jgi:hypothetical protein
MLPLLPSGAMARRASALEPNLATDAATDATADDPRLVPADKDARATARATAALLLRQQRFNTMVIQRSEVEREQEALDALLLAQMKHEDEMLKEWIRLV